MCFLSQLRRETSCNNGYQKHDPFFVENHFLCDMCPNYSQSNDPFTEWTSSVAKQMSRPLSLSNAANASGLADDYKRSHQRTMMSSLTQTYKPALNSFSINMQSMNDIIDPFISSFPSSDVDHLKVGTTTRLIQ